MSEHERIYRSRVRLRNYAMLCYACVYPSQPTYTAIGMPRIIVIIATVASRYEYIFSAIPEAARTTLTATKYVVGTA